MLRAPMWGGVIVPAGIPKPILARLNAEINRACAASTLIEKLAVVGNECVASTPEAFAEFIKKETVKWAEVVKRLGAKMN